MVRPETHKGSYEFLVRHHWMERVYRWMGIPDKVVKVLKVMMER